MISKERSVSQRINQAWLRLNEGERTRYINRMTQDRRDALRKGAEPEAGEENIAEYLQVIAEYLDSKKLKEEKGKK